MRRKWWRAVLLLPDTESQDLKLEEAEKKTRKAQGDMLESMDRMVDSLEGAKIRVSRGSTDTS